jgi:hypothetical protein
MQRRGDSFAPLGQELGSDQVRHEACCKSAVKKWQRRTLDPLSFQSMCQRGSLPQLLLDEKLAFTNIMLTEEEGASSTDLDGESQVELTLLDKEVLSQ